MPRGCTICFHERRAAIETELLRGTPYSTIAQNFNVSQHAVGRHKRLGHIETRVAKAVKNVERFHGVDYFDRLKDLEQKCYHYLNLAEQAKEPGAIARFIKETRETLKLILQIIHAEKAPEDVPAVNDISPAVQAIIDKEFETEAGEKEDRRSPKIVDGEKLPGLQSSRRNHV